MRCSRTGWPACERITTGSEYRAGRGVHAHPTASPAQYTARNHTEQVLGKLGVSSRAAVGALLYEQG